MLEIIKQISLREFKSEPESIEPILDKGVMNQVFKVRVGNIFYIFRLNKKGFLHKYLKERYCINMARGVGITVSECYAVGLEGDHSYMLLNYIDGINGSDTQGKEEMIYKKLGEYAKKFNAIEVSGYGWKVKDSTEGFYQTWAEYFEAEIEHIFGDRQLINEGILTTEQENKIKNRLIEMKGWNFAPMLCHGNLGVNNTIVTPEGDFYIIDWGNGAGHRSPHVDLADIIAWKSTRKYLEYFLEGYGMTMSDYEKIECDVNTVLIWRLMDIIKYSVKEGKGFKDKKFIDESVERIMNLK